MKELSPIEKYKAGQVVTSLEWNQQIHHFGQIVHEEWRKEQATAQYDLQGELYWKKVKPTVEMSPERAYLCRPSDVQKQWERGRIV